MPTLEKKLNRIRPRIEVISPIAGYAVLGFGILNVLLGISLFMLHAHFAGVALIDAALSYQLWGVLFFVSGCFLLYGFGRNLWDMMRRWLLITLCFKLIWLFALLFKFLGGSYSNSIILLIWAFITHIQALVYIFFLPVPPLGGGHE